MSHTKIRILIADDHRIFVEGLKRLIRQQNLHLAGTASSGAELLDLLEKKAADLVIMDIHMPDANGIKLTGQIIRKYPGVKVLGLTMVEDGRQIAAMMQAGASGYLLKTSTSAELLEAIRRVCNGERYLSQDASLRLLEAERSAKKKPQAPAIPLTRREQEILQLIARELTNNQIARMLNNSPMTIVTHRKNILRKLGVKNTAGLIRYAMQNGLVD
ncbi:MAG: response regulator transcription factor [Chitinophagales bacterium]|nr:response regulator transcription factor [Chitinophagales bacterium]MDW8393730.1 response regulator transcription factor [Chitinophagales bacterium]